MSFLWNLSVFLCEREAQRSWLLNHRKKIEVVEIDAMYCITHFWPLKIAFFHGYDTRLSAFFSFYSKFNWALQMSLKMLKIYSQHEINCFFACKLLHHCIFYLFWFFHKKKWDWTHNVFWHIFNFNEKYRNWTPKINLLKLKSVYCWCSILKIPFELNDFFRFDSITINSNDESQMNVRIKCVWA